MKKKRRLIIVILLAALLVGIVITFILKSKSNSYTLDEKQWIESNKNKVIDISILSDIPVLNYNGDGLLFSFLDEFEEELGLKFNKSAYKFGTEVNNDYVFKIVDEKKDNEILIMQDNYVFASSNNIIYSDVNDIKNLKIGILSSDMAYFDSLFDDSVELVPYDTFDDLFNSLSSEDKNDGIIILKTLIMEKLIDDNLNISYQFFNKTKDYVISLNGNDQLNSILTKFYNKWFNEKYKTKYNYYLLQQYYDFKNVKDSDRTSVKSKKYVYGFVDNGVFDWLNGSNFKGINNLILKNFSNFSGVSLSYKKYNTYSDLINAYNDGTIDVFMNYTNINEFKRDSIITFNGFNNKLLIVSKNNNPVLIDSLYGLSDKNVAIVESSKMEEYLRDLNVKFHKYKNLKDLLSHVTDTDFVIIDSENYNYYKSSDLMDYKINYFMDNSITYNYVVGNDDIVFANLFDFYITYSSCNNIINDNYSEVAYNNINYLYILIIVIVLFVISIILVSINKVKKYLISRKKRRRINLSKFDKIKYIDQLTSLKNRAYLNSKIDSWDNSDVYPQSIIIVDLNNISAINDNYGREEGDRVIVEAASILINSQLPNSEIIRTDGNEFLIYLVGYSEKHVITYLRSISREMKKLSHGFGAATGYSMIVDGIKTVDDAVNEATLDMKNNKEDIDY